MKKIILVGLILISFCSVHSKQDSTLMVYKHSESKEMKLLYELLGVQYESISFSDTNIRDKKIFLSIDEYEKGKIIRTDSLNLSERVDTIPTVMPNGDTMIYILDNASKVMFSKYLNEYNIDFMGKFDKDTMLLLLNFPKIRMTTKLRCNNMYMIRPANPCGESDTVVIGLNKSVPIFSFNPPFKIGENAGNYCIVATKDPKDWYKEYKIEHYYMFNILIK